MYLSAISYMKYIYFNIKSEIVNQLLIQPYSQHFNISALDFIAFARTFAPLF